MGESRAAGPTGVGEILPVLMCWRLEGKLERALGEESVALCVRCDGCRGSILLLACVSAFVVVSCVVALSFPSAVRCIFRRAFAMCVAV